jgi:tetratricopeptide (TPR) repeat protein
MLASRWLACGLACCGMLVGCQSPQSPAAAPSAEGFDVLLATEWQTLPEPQRDAWAAYAFGRGAAYLKGSSTRKNPSGDDFAIERFARDYLADYWREQRAKGAADDDYLDRLVALDDEGHVAEHVLVSLAKPGWTIPADDLARIDFAALAELARAPIEAPTPAVARPRSGPIWSEVPGRSLPDPGSLAPPGVPCAQSMPELRRAMAAWDREAAGLDGSPAAADDRASFLALLAAAEPDSPFRTHGATWVPLRVYWLSFLAGFCAIDLQEYAPAERWLERAVAMLPEHPQARMELTHALVFQRKFDRADAILDHAIATSQDRCELARAWRRRGYIRFEQRRLEESRIAYQRSLEYDPDSEIARSELDLLRRTIEQQGGHPDWYVPPPSVSGTTVCPTA